MKPQVTQKKATVAKAGLGTMPEASSAAARAPKLGELLLRTGAVDRDGLEDALAKQRRNRRLLGEILVESGVPLAVVTSALLRQVKLQATGGRVGALVVELGLATPSDVGRALFRQVQTRAPIGEVLVELGVLSPGDLEKVLTVQRRRDEEDAVFRAEAAFDTD